jgi:iron complex outermembrane receptor protein
MMGVWFLATSVGSYIGGNIAGLYDTWPLPRLFLVVGLTGIVSAFVMLVGTKVEHTTYSGFNYQPNARLAWTPNGQHTVWGAVTRAVRTASRIEDGFRFTALIAPITPPLYVRLIGDGQFDSEELMGYEVGFRNYVSSRGFFLVSLFHNRYDDLLGVESRPTEIEAEPEPLHQVIPLDLRNGVIAQSSGGELSGLWDVHDWMRLRASYSYVHLDAKRKPTSNDASTVRQLEGDTPRHKVVLQSAISLPKQFELNLAFRYVSSMANQAVGAYSTGDVRVGRRLGEHFEVEVVGRNLLQPFHTEYGGLPGPQVGIRRSGFLAVTWRSGR